MGGRHAGPLAALLAPGLVLAVLAATTGLGTAGAVTGAAAAVVLAAALAHGLGAGDRLGPASWVTLARAVLAIAVAALVADSVTHAEPVALVVALAAVALALDLADGRLARRTGTASAFGARFDGEVDAFLILALSLYAVPLLGPWAAAIGLARYAFGAGEWAAPWMRAPLPPRRWRKLVAAAQGVVLTIAAADVLPRGLMGAVTAVALVALTASMGECVWWLWRRRRLAPARAPSRPAVAAALTGLAVLVLWAALVAPDRPNRFGLDAFARLPLELLVVVLAAAVLPALPRRALALAAGAVLGGLVVVKVLDVGFLVAYDRRFDPVNDWAYAGVGVDTLRETIGRARADLVVAGMAVAGAAVLALPMLALLRVTRAAAAHRGRALQAAAVLAVAWAALRVLDAPVASTSATALVVRQVDAVRAGLHDREVFARALARDAYRGAPGARLLTGLRGKDVLLLFVESYGRVAVDGSAVAPRIGAVLDRGTRELRAAGYGARSGFLTSSTFGGLSWLAHATLQTGVEVDGQRRYNQVHHSDRLPLTRAFREAGWRTVGVMPENKRAWPEGRTFYRFERLYDRHDIGYRGPRFGLPTMPDQFALAVLQREELARRDRPPVFAEVDFVSSHAPWAQIPRLVPWAAVGDGAIFHELPRDAPDGTLAAYATSIEYTLRTIVSFVREYGDEDLVLVILGDHQPATTVTGHGAGRDVPVSIVAHDPAVLDRVAGWHWDAGLRPGPGATVWPMRAFRDRFLDAYGPRTAGR